jgi:hypothetical protein
VGTGEALLGPDLAGGRACGCDACDSGAQFELDELDRSIIAIMLGAFRRLSRGDPKITVLGHGSWSATDVPPRQVPAILAKPTGWDQLSGESWLGER